MLSSGIAGSHVTSCTAAMLVGRYKRILYNIILHAIVPTNQDRRRVFVLWIDRNPAITRLLNPEKTRGIWLRRSSLFIAGVPNRNNLNL